MLLPKLRLPVILTFTLIISSFLTACNGGAASSPPSSDGQEKPTEPVLGELPADYQDLTNPYASDADASSSGSKLFIANCATCHGENGDGDGPAAAGLTPQPAALSNADLIGGLSDAYLFWRISEGGASAPFNSAMPSWKGTFKEEQIWQLVTFIRSLSN
jgi:mono/diheme cytochrome c family protein